MEHLLLISQKESFDGEICKALPYGKHPQSSLFSPIEEKQKHQGPTNSHLWVQTDRATTLLTLTTEEPRGWSHTQDREGKHGSDHRGVWGHHSVLQV